MIGETSGQKTMCFRVENTFVLWGLRVFTDSLEIASPASQVLHTRKIQTRLHVFSFSTNAHVLNVTTGGYHI